MRGVIVSAGEGLDLAMDQLLEGAALARPRLLGLGDASRRLVLVLELDDLTGQRLDPLAVGLALGLLPSSELLERVDDAALEIVQWAGAVLSREQLHHRGSLLVQGLRQQLVDLLLD